MLSPLSNYLTPTGDLVLKEKNLKSLPRSILEISNEILQLDLRNNTLTHLPNTLSSLTHLRSLDLRYNTLELIPESISSLIHLKILRLDNNHLSYLPIELFSLTSLSILTLNRNSICSIPHQISNLKQLNTLVLSSNHLKSLPNEISALKKLRNLYIHGNDFSVLPASICALSALAEFSLEWFRYCNPPLPRVLKTKIGEAIIESLLALCSSFLENGEMFVNLLAFVQHFSNEEFSIVKVDQKNRTYLHIAVISGDNGVMQGLISSGCKIDSLDSDGFSPFVLALKENNLQAANLLMSSGADLTIGAGCFGSPLNVAVIKSDIKIVTKLLEAGLSPNIQDLCGNTALHSLMEVFDKHRHKNALIGKMLLDHGADPLIENHEKWSPVHVATKEKQRYGLKWMKKCNTFLIQQKRTVFSFNQQGGAHGWRPLHIASHTGDYSLSETLISLGSDPSLKNSDNKTAKDTSRGNLSLYKYLSRLENQCYLLRKDQENEYKSQVLPKNGNSSTISSEYSILYTAYKYKDRDEIEDLLSDCENPIVKADCVYLLSSFKYKQSLKAIYKAKKNKEMIVKSEVRHAMNYLNEPEGVKSMPSLKLSTRVNLQRMNLVEFVEEETRMDTLLMFSN